MSTDNEYPPGFYRIVSGPHAGQEGRLETTRDFIRLAIKDTKRHITPDVGAVDPASLGPVPTALYTYWKPSKKNAAVYLYTFVDRTDT